MSNKTILDYDKLIDKQSKKLVGILKKNNIKLITAESLTAGMIVSSLVNQPGTSGEIYGGVATYFTEAKRRFLNVKAKNVYTHRCAKEMAEGAIEVVKKDCPKNNLIAIAVTGHAGPYYDWRDDKTKGVNPVLNWGKVHIGISVLVKGSAKEKNNIPNSNDLYNNKKYTDIKKYRGWYLKTSTIGIDICNTIHFKKNKMSRKNIPKFCRSIKKKFNNISKNKDEKTLLRNIIRKCTCMLAIKMAIKELL